MVVDDSRLLMVDGREREEREREGESSWMLVADWWSLVVGRCGHWLVTGLQSLVLVEWPAAGETARMAEIEVGLEKRLELVTVSRGRC